MVNNPNKAARVTIKIPPKTIESAPVKFKNILSLMINGDASSNSKVILVMNCDKKSLLIGLNDVKVKVNIDAIKRVHSYFNGKLKLEIEPSHGEVIIVGKDKASTFNRWIDK